MTENEPEIDLAGISNAEPVVAAEDARSFVTARRSPLPPIS
jgi:hypothetical protein